MELDFSRLSTTQVYHTVIQTVIPRPIAWTLSLNKNNTFNLAPFSYFNAVSSQPPLLMICVDKKPDGSSKDTLINIKARKHFVIHIASAEQVADLNNSSANLPNEESEVDSFDLKTTPFDTDFPLPRLNACRVAYACELHEIHEIGNAPMSMILGEIKSLYIDDDIIDTSVNNRLKIDALKLNPLARLGGNNYSSLADIMTVKRPE